MVSHRNSYKDVDGKMIKANCCLLSRKLNFAYLFSVDASKMTRNIATVALFLSKISDNFLYKVA